MDLLDRRERPLLRLLGAAPASGRSSIRPQATLGKSPPATARCPRSSASVTSDTRSRLSPSRLHLHGWQCIDELNRAFAGQPPSTYVAPVHLFTSANIDKDGGAQNIFDPGNGYKDEYRKIWASVAL